MYQFTLKWIESDQLCSKTFSATEAEQRSAVFTIGRDEQQCDIVVSDSTNTVSRLHAEIFLKPERQKLYLRNATGERAQPNFVMVDRQKVVIQDIALKAGSEIQLGKLLITVAALEISQPRANQSQNEQSQNNRPLQHQEYGLQCINGHQVSYDHVRLFCPYCGTALQAVNTVIVDRTNKPT